jgi:outer membrane protein TolC
MYRLYSTRLLKKLSVFGFCLLLCGGVQAQESMMQDISYPFLEKLIATARANYPKLKAYNTRIRIAQAGMRRTQMSYFDILSFSYLYSPTNNPGLVNPNINTNYLFGYQFGAFVNIGGILQKPAQVRQAREEIQLARGEHEAYELNLAAEVEQRYYTYVEELATLRLRSQLLLDAENMVKNIRNKFERGEETLDNYNKTLISYANYQSEKIRAEGAVLVAKSRLEELLGTKLEQIQ